jgi:hypothetical protein
MEKVAEGPLSESENLLAWNTPETAQAQDTVGINLWLDLPT